MFEQTAMQDPARFLAAVTEQLAKLPSQLWRTGNEGFAPIAAAMAALSCLRLSPMDNGMIQVSGQLDPEAGAVLVATLDPLSAPNPCDANGGRDPRPPDRRRAEALIEVCRRAALTTLPLAPLGGPTYARQRGLTAVVTAHGVTWQT